MARRLTEERSGRVVLRLSPDVLEQLDETARMQGLSRSLLVERLVLAGLGPVTEDSMPAPQERASGVQVRGGAIRSRGGSGERLARQTPTPAPMPGVSENRQPTTRPPPPKYPPYESRPPVAAADDEGTELEQRLRAACASWPGEGPAEAARNAARDAMRAAIRGAHDEARKLASLAQELERHHHAGHEAFDGFYQRLVYLTAKDLLADAIRNGG